MGLVYLARGSRADAMAAFEKATSLDPDMSEALNSQGGIWFESGDLQHAISAFREAIRIRPDYAEARSNLGNALSSARSFPEARYEFEAALRFKPNRYAAARYNYGVALARVNRLDEAQRQIEAALQSDPAIVEAHDLLGNVLIARGECAIRAGSIPRGYKDTARLRTGPTRHGCGARRSPGKTAAAIPYLRKAAESPQQAVRDEARQTLQKLGLSR